MMQMLDIFLHEYKHENRSAEVWLYENGVFVTRHFNDKMWIKDVVHYGHNELWAENAAENWVLMGDMT